jgi:hypothetical protein
MQHLEVSSAVRRIYMTLGGKGLSIKRELGQTRGQFSRHVGAKYTELRCPENSLYSCSTRMLLCIITAFQVLSDT